MDNNNNNNKYETLHKSIFIDSRKLSNNIEQNSIDLIVTSPPYPMIKMWDTLFNNLNKKITLNLIENNPFKAFELMHKELDKVYEECIKIIKNDGIICINIGDATRTTDIFRLFPNHQRTIQFFLKKGFSQIPSIIWSKPTNSLNKFMGSGMLPTSPYVTLEHEYILIFRKQKREFNSKLEKENRSKSAFFQHERNNWCTDTWNILGVRQKLNNGVRSRNAAYSLDIPYRLISLFSVKNDWILDPFGGTGTTTIAAMGLARNSVLVEISEKFNTDIKKRCLSSKEMLNNKLQERINSLKKINENFKYFNEYENVKVRTKQETKLTFSFIKKIENIDDDIKVTYLT